MIRTIMKRASCVVAMTMVAALSVFAQSTGRIAGRVTDAAGAPIGGVQMIVSPSGVSALTLPDGHYTVRSVPAGVVSIRTYRIGYKAKIIESTVVAGQDVTVDVQLEAATVQLAGIVTSASRRVEKVTDAPATITRLEEAQIANTIGNSFASALKEVKGLEFIQTGILTSAVNARGFNSSFNNRMSAVKVRFLLISNSTLP